MTPRMQSFERETLRAVIHSKRVWLIHVITNALLMVAFFYWLRIAEESGVQFALSVVSGLLIIFVTLWLHCATFDYFRVQGEMLFKRSLLRSLARVPAFLVWALIFGFVLWLIGQLWGYDEQIGGWLRHILPRFIRRSVAPRSVISGVAWLLWFLSFFLWPISFLPVGAQVAVGNFRGFLSANALRPLRSIRFWILYFVCFMLGAYVPFRFAWMTPKKASSLNAETWSMVVRLGVGYLLLVTAWLVLCAAIMRASDGEATSAVESEPKSLPASPASVSIL